MNDFFVADDLSGALDAAAAFHRAGRRVTIALSVEKWADAGEDEIVGITTETRNLPAAMAAKMFANVMVRAAERGARLVYKKIDSTLRGPVGAELSALAEALPGKRILFAPANPGVGRTVRNGEVLVRGVPLAQTEFARDPASPVKHSSIRGLLGAAVTGRVIIPDVETEADLVAAVARMDAGGESWIPIGSGALARPVAARMTKPRMLAAPEAESVRAGPILMLCGSAHRINREQAAVLARERGLAVYELRLDSPEREIPGMVEKLQRNVGTTMLMAANPADSKAVIRTFATVAAEIVGRSGVRRIFLTGGESAFAVCRTLKIETLRFQREIESGLSLSRGQGAAGSFLLAVKPGAFGDLKTWVRAFDALK
jgi:uncharacterized protein YgbK (DUF1537 family)